MTVEVMVDYQIDDFNPNNSESFLNQLLTVADEEHCEVSLRYVDDTTIRELNNEYRGIDNTTDVLSFCMREGDIIGVPTLLGDIVISLDTAKRHASSIGHTLEEEVYELLFHGFLHLLGYDHENNPNQWNEQEQRLKHMLTEINAIYIPHGIKTETITHQTESEGRLR